MLLTLHNGLANAATLFALILAGWAFLRAFQGKDVDGSYLGGVVIGEILMVVQGVIGGMLYAGGSQPARVGMHILYGVVTLIAFPAFYAAIRGRDSRREMILWGVVALFVFGVTIRARMVS